MVVFFVYVTCASRNEALKIANAAVKERLAACANVFQPHTAIYKWKEKACCEKEVALILKTTNAKYAALEKRVKQLHSYELPCIIAFQAKRGSKDFIKWVEESCEPQFKPEFVKEVLRISKKGKFIPVKDFAKKFLR